MEDSREDMILEALVESSDSDFENEFAMNFFFEELSLVDSAEVEEDNHASVESFLMTVEAFSPEDFKTHFRLRRSTVEHLISSYCQHYFSVHSSNRGGRIKIGYRKEIFMYVWYISNTITFRQLGNLFGVTKSSSWVSVNRVAKWLVSKGPNYIKWPLGTNVNDNCRRFEEKKRIPGVLGAIDCTHITIAAPKVDKECYYNRKHQFTIVLQAVVDADKKFIDVSCGEPGSLHDSRVLRRSELYKKAQVGNNDVLFPSNTFLLGDSAYAATNWLVPPFRDNGRLTEQQRAFNYIHSSTRIVVEHSFGLLKGRFRRLLKFTEQRDIRSVTTLVVSACILHNICIMRDDTFEVPREELNDADTRESHGGNNPNPTNRRQILFDHLCANRII